MDILTLSYINLEVEDTNKLLVKVCMLKIKNNIKVAKSSFIKLNIKNKKKIYNPTIHFLFFLYSYTKLINKLKYI